MNARGGSTRLACAGLAAASAYAALAWQADAGSGAGWLIGAQAAGWLALATGLGCGRFLDTRTGLGWIVGAAVVFRLCGLFTTPAWEDDYFRHLWDGWMTWQTGSPYGVAPMEWFGGTGLSVRMEAVLDGVNHPDHATIYGPVVQLWAMIAAGGGAGWLWVFKAGLVLAEGAACVVAWRLGGGRALLFAAWCPLAVTEIAFAGHVDALVMAALAAGIFYGERNRPVAACAWVALAGATKGYALLFAPFFLWRGGWRGAACFAGVLWGAYLPWVIATVQAGRGATSVLGLGGVGAMTGGFEFNSTGYAVLAWLLGDGPGRWLAGALLFGGWGVIFARWAGAGHPGGTWCFVKRRGAVCKRAVGRWLPEMAMGGAVPGMAMVGWWALWSPVFHPWYALAALPFLALRPSGWGTAMLAALPLSYAHGLNLAPGTAGSTGDFRHPWWVRPAEVAGVAAGALAGWLRSRSRR